MGCGWTVPLILSCAAGEARWRRGATCVLGARRRFARGMVLGLDESSREKAARKEGRRKAFFLTRPLRAGLTYAAPSALVMRGQRCSREMKIPKQLKQVPRRFARSG